MMNLCLSRGDTPEMICFNLAGIVASCYAFWEFVEAEHRFLRTVR